MTNNDTATRQAPAHDEVQTKARAGNMGRWFGVLLSGGGASIALVQFALLGNPTFGMVTLAVGIALYTLAWLVENA